MCIQCVAILCEWNRLRRYSTNSGGIMFQGFCSCWNAIGSSHSFYLFYSFFFPAFLFSFSSLHNLNTSLTLSSFLSLSCCDTSSRHWSIVLPGRKCKFKDLNSFLNWQTFKFWQIYFLFLQVLYSNSLKVILYKREKYFLSWNRCIWVTKVIFELTHVQIIFCVGTVICGTRNNFLSWKRFRDSTFYFGRKVDDPCGFQQQDVSWRRGFINFIILYIYKICLRVVRVKVPRT